MATSSSASQSSGSSSSVPGLLPSPQTDFSLQLSQWLQSLSQSQAQWAAQQFAQTSAVTDAQINNYLAEAQQGSDLAGSMLNDYENVFAPMQDQYAANAGQYASQGRINNEMGMAESNSMQAGNAAKINAEQELQSFGIDPSSGRYQDLVRASDTANAAAAAGAGETARLNTEQEGQRRLVNAIEMGQQLPGNTVNALNSAYQGIAGAENAVLGNANTGVNLTTSPNTFAQTAQNVKVPPVGNTSRSSQGSTSGTVSGGGGSNGNSNDPFNMDRFGRSQPNAPGGSSGAGSAPAFSNPGGGVTIQNPYAAPGGGDQWSMVGPESNDGIFNPGSADSQSPYTDNGWSSGGNQWDPNAGFSTPQWDDQSWNGGSTYGGDLSTPQANWPDPSQGYSDPSQGYADPSAGYDTSGWDTSGSGDLGSWSTAGTQDWSGSSGDADWGDYARGGNVSQGRGMIPQPGQGGGHVPRQMSPSGGRQTDDIQAVIPQTGGRAMLNADEFVIPRDVVKWKGQEFFQKMIAQSRKSRTGAPAKPQRG
jgi:hypothetical protein